MEFSLWFGSCRPANTSWSTLQFSLYEWLVVKSVSLWVEKSGFCFHPCYTAPILGSMCVPLCNAMYKQEAENPRQCWKWKRRKGPRQVGVLLHGAPLTWCTFHWQKFFSCSKHQQHHRCSSKLQSLCLHWDKNKDFKKIPSCSPGCKYTAHTLNII